MDECDRQGICARMSQPSGKHDVACIGLVDSRQHFDQGRFARPVLSQQRVDLAAAYVEIDVVEREGPGEALDEAGHRQQRRWPGLRTGLVKSVHH
jgi:hypothetical protein